MVSRERIIAEIQRVAEESDGRAPGQMFFASSTGITDRQWRGRYWSRWSEAVAEAGFSPNSMVPARDLDTTAKALALETRRLGRFPTESEIDLRRRNDKTIPSLGALRRIGDKSSRVALVRDFCARDPETWEDVALLLPSVEPRAEEVDSTEPVYGHVYLLKSGKHYKIGRSSDATRRHRELAIQLPTATERVHTISTDDPVGIERYWHERFAAKRLNGEWFDLDAADVAAFKRRRTM